MLVPVYISTRQEKWLTDGRDLGHGEGEAASAGASGRYGTTALAEVACAIWHRHGPGSSPDGSVPGLLYPAPGAAAAAAAAAGSWSQGWDGGGRRARWP